MSVRVMAKAWDTDLPATDKLVLLALADWSNDQGHCWPSISQLAEKCGLTDRGVQKVLVRLESDGHIDRQIKPGKGVNYTVHPRTTFTPTPEHGSPVTPEPRSPRTTFAPNESAKTPEHGSPNTSVTVSTVEASASTDTRARDCDAIVEHWNSMARRVGLAQITKLTDKRRKACHARVRDDGLDAIRQAIDRIPSSPFLMGETGSWRANFDFLIRPDTVTRINEGNFDGRHNRPANDRRDEPANPMLAALQRRRAAEAGGGFPTGDRPALGYPR